MRHAGAEISPAHSLQHRILDLLALGAGQISAGRLHETLDVELGLLLNASIEECSDLGVFGKSLVNLLGGGIDDDFLNHQGIELGVLGFFQPMMLEQALELSVKFLAVAHAFDIVPEGNPFDVEDRDAGPETGCATAQNARYPQPVR